MDYNPQTYIPATIENETPRPQINEAVITIAIRHELGESTTSIVMPPRFGKTSVIQLSALELTQTGLASAALALAPWEQIADQLVAKKQLEKLSKRFLSRAAPKAPDQFRGTRVRNFHPSFHETSLLTHLFTSTIQLARYNDNIIVDWIERCCRYGARPVIYIDESQLLSTSNSWGSNASNWIASGAHIVLLTGTPYRADSTPIPGFKIVTSERNDWEYKKCSQINDEYLKVETFGACTFKQKLKANYEVTFQDAWDQKALVKIEPIWINADISIKEEQQKFIDLPPSLQDKYRRRVSVDNKFIVKTMDAAIKDMKHRRLNKKHSNSAMLVITASDMNLDGNDVNDETANYHARKVRDAVKSIDGNLSVSIATQASDRFKEKESKKAKDKINSFVGYTKSGITYEPTGDILIVKNMGTVGLDSDRLKTIVFIGTVRQWASWIQAVLRGGTTWDDITHMTVVLLDDKANREVWKLLISDEGGEYLHTTIDDVPKAVSIEEDKIKNTPSLDPEVTIVSANIASAEDSHSKGSITETFMEQAYRLIAKKPELRERFSLVEISEYIRDGVMVAPNKDESTKQDEIGVIDVGDECLSISKDLEANCQAYANALSPYRKGNVEWVSHKKAISNAARSAGGLRCTPAKETDPSRLRNALAYVKSQLDIRGIPHAD